MKRCFFIGLLLLAPISAQASDWDSRPPSSCRIYAKEDSAIPEEINRNGNLDNGQRVKVCYWREEHTTTYARISAARKGLQGICWITTQGIVWDGEKWWTTLPTGWSNTSRSPAPEKFYMMEGNGDCRPNLEDGYVPSDVSEGVFKAALGLWRKAAEANNIEAIKAANFISSKDADNFQKLFSNPEQRDGLLLMRVSTAFSRPGYSLVVSRGGSFFWWLEFDLTDEGARLQEIKGIWED